MAISKKEIVDQSNAALNQWGAQWRRHAIEHSSYDMIPFREFQNIGVGKTLLLVANGFSFEENIELIKKYKDNVDIMACDKTLGVLLDHGITPKYCMVCDANVDYKKYCEPWKDQLKDTILFQNVAGNPKFTSAGKWAKVVFFVNEDAIHSEIEFQKISKCSNTIPAATNVSGAMLVLATQSKRNQRNNYFGYDKLLLIGYDYSWKEGHYYAFNKRGDGKDNYMRHIQMPDRNGDLCYTSHNLHFSARWLTDYIRNFHLPCIMGSGSTLVGHVPIKDFEKEIQYNFKIDDGPKVRKMVIELQEYKLQASQIESKLLAIGNEHWLEFKQSI